MGRDVRATGGNRSEDRRASSPWAALDGDWYYLGVEAEGAFAIALLTREGVSAAPLFTSREQADRLLDSVPPGTGVHALAASDMRAKEEWLRAAVQQGAVTLAIEPEPVELEPHYQLELDKALAYILSHRRHTACI